MYGAVLDANVYVSAIIRPEGPPGEIIERFVRDRAFDLVLSGAIAEEVLRALAYPKVRKCIRRKIDPTLWFENIFLLARVVPGEYKVSGVSRDPDDDKCLAAAVEGRCQYAVTGDPDLLVLEHHDDVQIVSPKTFLDLLRASRPAST
ncbi:MAG: putative toxin-antitoxin system toxin component, PIN family [Vicinamibacteraceae bacterium]